MTTRHRRRFLRLGSFMLAIWQSFIWCIACAPLAVAAPAPASSPTAPAAPAALRSSPAGDDLQATIAGCDRLARIARSLDAQTPSDSFAPEAVLAKTGKDRDRIFAWVVANTSWVPYRGLLRGVTGVLLDRVGNSLDRSLLLADLLSKAGFSVRLAHAKLGLQTATALLEKVAPPPSKGSPDTAGEPLAQVIARNARQYGVGETELQARIARELQRSLGLAKRISDRVSEQSAQLTSLLGSPSSPQADPAAQRAWALQAIADHWWLQVREGDRWKDLDLQAADGKPGSSISPASDTIPFDGIDKLLAGSSLSHRLGIRVLIERWKHGRVSEVPVLSVTLDAAKLVGKRLRIAHLMPRWPQDLDPIKDSNLAATIRKVILAQNEWVPAIQVDSDNRYQKTFNASGDTAAYDPSKAAEFGATQAGGFAGLTHALDSIGGPPAQSHPDAYLTAEWVEYTIHTPGQRAHRFRREIFDLLGPAVRRQDKIPAPTMTPDKVLERGLALMGEIDALPMVCDWTPEYLTHLQMRDLAQTMEEPGKIAHAGAPVAQMDRSLAMGSVPAHARTLLQALAVGRSRWRAASAGVFVDRVNLLTYRTRPVVSGASGLALRQNFDIVANEVAVRPGSAVESWRSRLAQGILDTAAEALLVSPTGKENTSQLFALSDRSTWRVVRTTKDAAWSALRLSPDVLARIEADLAAGYVAILPQAPIRLDGQELAGWWRIDPATGDILGRMERGEGQGLTEYNTIGGYLFYAAAVMGFLGCGGQNATSHTGAKFLGCLLCALLSGIAAYIGVITIPMGLTAGATLGIAAGSVFGVGIPCTIFSNVDP